VHLGKSIIHSHHSELSGSVTTSYLRANLPSKL
jgi:hypothetical protein